MRSIHAGKLPIETDTNWIPPVQDDDFNTKPKAESPPPVPPKTLVSTKSSESLSHWPPAQGVDYGRQMMPVPVESEPIPALPPKPSVINIPPRPPK